MRPIPPYFDAICRTTRLLSRARGTAQRTGTPPSAWRQDRKDLGFAISRHLHQNLLMHSCARKFYFAIPLSFWGGLALMSLDISTST